MGTSAIMSESFEKATNFIIRFHATCLQSTKDIDGIKCYPLMDGIFITSQDVNIIKRAINAIFQSLSEIFCEEDVFDHQFIVRSAIAKGGMSFGENIDENVCSVISSDNEYKASLLFGMPMIQAYKAEEKAPPFGVYIHESARDYEQLVGRYYWWYKDKDTQTTLKEGLLAYFDWCKDYSQYLEMNDGKIENYKKLANEYFSDRKNKNTPYKKG